MPLLDDDLLTIRKIVREEIENAFSALFTATRLEDFAGMMTPAVEARVREALANIEHNSEKI
ncbi:MAG: hypothetical protein ACR2IH_14010 [Pyrinomonadaceae bacterium]